jgi:hypothetical protein
MTFNGIAAISSPRIDELWGTLFTSDITKVPADIVARVYFP